MKKSLLFVGLLLAMSLTASAQYKGFSFGFKLGPSFDWTGSKTGAATTLLASNVKNFVGYILEGHAIQMNCKPHIWPRTIIAIIIVVVVAAFVEISTSNKTPQSASTLRPSQLPVAAIRTKMIEPAMRAIERGDAMAETTSIAAINVKSPCAKIPCRTGI